MSNTIRFTGLAAACLLLVPSMAAQVDDGLDQGLTATPQAGRRAAPAPKGDRLLSLSLTLPEDDDFAAALDLARQVGVQTTALDVFWDDLETAPGVYAPDPDWLAIANAYYPTQDMPVMLGVHPIDTNNLRVPADLVGLPFDDPAVIARFESLLDFVFAQIPDLDLVDMAIGNEIDVTLGTDAALWSRYETLFEAGAVRARSLRPGLAVGTKITFAGITGTAPTEAQSINASADVVLMTYYPLNGDFTVRPPSVVTADMTLALDLFPGDKPLHLREAGYPSGTLCNSSELAQATFVTELFKAWDVHRDRLKLVELVWMHEISAATLEFYELYYGVSDPVFLEYLGTLGVRTFEGTGQDKPAFTRFAQEAALRGW